MKNNPRQEWLDSLKSNDQVAVISSHGASTTSVVRGTVTGRTGKKQAIKVKTQFGEENFNKDGNRPSGPYGRNSLEPLKDSITMLERLVPEYKNLGKDE